MAAARRLVRDRRVTVTDIEARIGTRYTAATLTELRRRYPGVRFVWLMGADNLAGFHRWDRWRTILAMVPVACWRGRASSCEAGLSPAARAYARWRVPQRVGRGARRHAAAGLGAAVGADARPLLDRAPGARALEALSGGRR